MNSKTWPLAELQRRSGVKARTLRYWIKTELLPKPVGRGRASRYTEEHLLRAQLIRQLRVQGLGFSEIRAQLGELSQEQVAARLSRPVSEVPAPPTNPSYPNVSWQVVPLLDGLALFVNPARGAIVQRIAEQIYRHYAIVSAHASL